MQIGIVYKVELLHIDNFDARQTFEEDNT